MGINFLVAFNEKRNSPDIGEKKRRKYTSDYTILFHLFKKVPEYPFLGRVLNE